MSLRRSSALTSMAVVAFVGMCATPARGDVVKLTSLGLPFNITPNSTGGIAADATHVYISFTDAPQIDIYTAGGLTDRKYLDQPIEARTFLGGYTGITLDGNHFLLVAMRDFLFHSSLYTFDMDGHFILNGRVDMPDAVLNATGVAVRGTEAYVTQNNSPLVVRRVRLSDGAILQTFPTNSRGDRLGIDYWATGDFLFEGYQNGVSVLDRATGNELQHFTVLELGYDEPTYGVAIFGDTLYAMTQTKVYTYSLTLLPTAVPEPAGFALTAFVALALAHQGWRRRWLSP